MKNKQKKNQGFTLVELIVVLVILAILAAILIPALLGYIDRTRETSLLTKSRRLMTAIQTEIAETYAVGEFTATGNKNNFDSKNIPSIRHAVELSELEDFGDPGTDWVHESGYAIYNGFGYGQSGYTATPAKYHFKVLIGTNGKIEDFVLCDKERTAHWANDAFEVKAADTCEYKNSNKVYNYLYIHKSATAVNNYKNKAPKW